MLRPLTGLHVAGESQFHFWTEMRAKLGAKDRLWTFFFPLLADQYSSMPKGQNSAGMNDHIGRRQQ